MDRAYYSRTISAFCRAGAEQVLGEMAQRHGFDLTGAQRDAWMEMGRRIDAVWGLVRGWHRCWTGF